MNRYAVEGTYREKRGYNFNEIAVLASIPFRGVDVDLG